MKKGHLSDYFQAIAAKRLSAVEADEFRSNQHEFNGIAAFREIFGTQKRTLDAKFIFLSDDPDEVTDDIGTLTWYDAREKHATRTEYRLYYQSVSVFNRVNESDLLVLCQIDNENSLVILAESGSTVENQLCWLFNLDTATLTQSFETKSFTKGDDSRLDFIGNLILEHLGIDVSENLIQDDILEVLLRKFPSGFPSTAEFSAFARENLSVAADKPDFLLMAWLEHEEILFRTFEKYIVGQKLEKGFEDVDDFVSFSLSVHGRRKSRAGLAFENHLQVIFDDHQIPHSRNKVTELRYRPDFVFPSILAYHDDNYPQKNLFMLAVKRSCKDRWRQILPEAARLPRKHLITTEPSISFAQTQQMVSEQVQLVIPEAIQKTYQPIQLERIISLDDFVSHLESVLKNG